MDFDLVRYQVTDHVAEITLDRPKVRNALNPAAYAQLEGAFKRRAIEAPARYGRKAPQGAVADYDFAQRPSHRQRR